MRMACLIGEPAVGLNHDVISEKVGFDALFEQFVKQL